MNLKHTFLLILATEWCNFQMTITCELFFFEGMNFFFCVCDQIKWLNACDHHQRFFLSNNLVVKTHAFKCGEVGVFTSFSMCLFHSLVYLSCARHVSFCTAFIIASLYKIRSPSFKFTKSIFIVKWTFHDFNGDLIWTIGLWNILINFKKTSDDITWQYPKWIEEINHITL